MSRDALMFPSRFLKRFEDRRMIIEGKSAQLFPPDVLELSLFKAWQEYASSGSDRHEIQAAEVQAEDPTVMMLEDFVGCLSDGKWVELAVKAGFLKIETCDRGKHWLVCYGFFPLNRHLSPSYVHNQGLGGLAKKVKKVDRMAQADAGKQLDLLMRDRESVIAKAAATPAEKEECVALVRNIYGLLGQDLPREGFSEIMDDCLMPALEVVRGMDDGEVDEVKMHIYRSRERAAFPKDVKVVLEKFSELMEL